MPLVTNDSQAVGVPGVAAPPVTTIQGVAGMIPVATSISSSSAAGTPSTSNVISVQGGYYRGTALLTRAANQTPYSIGDVVGGPLTLVGAGPVNGDVLLTSVRIKSIGAAGPTALPSGLATFNLQVYNATPPSAIADNSPWTFAQGDWASYIAAINNIPVAALGTGSQGISAFLDNIVEQFRCDPSGDLFCYVVTNQAFTPAANSETYQVDTRGVLP